VAALLEAIGAPTRSDPELVNTPALASAALIDELLDGYRVDPRAILRDGGLAGAPGLVVLTGIRYVSMCPHHLLPSAGVAHLGYVSRGRVAGLGALVRVVDAFAHRLILQEALGAAIAREIMSGLDAAGAGVVLVARHACLSSRGVRQSDASVITESFAGTLELDSAERERFTRAVSLAARTAEPSE